MTNLVMGPTKAQTALDIELRRITGGAGVAKYRGDGTVKVVVPKSSTTREIECKQFVSNGFAVVIETPDYVLNQVRINEIVAGLLEQGIKPEETVLSTTSVWQLHNPYVEETFYILHHPKAELKFKLEGDQTVNVSPKYIDLKRRVDFPEDLGGLGVLKDAKLDYIRKFNFFEKEQATIRQRANFEKFQKGER